MVCITRHAMVNPTPKPDRDQCDHTANGAYLIGACSRIYCWRLERAIP